MGLLYKIKQNLPHCYELLKFYLTDKFFQVNQNGRYSKIYPILAGVPQNSVLGPTLYQIYTAGNVLMRETYSWPHSRTTPRSSHENPVEASRFLLWELWLRLQSRPKSGKLKATQTNQHASHLLPGMLIVLQSIYAAKTFRQRTVSDISCL